MTQADEKIDYLSCSNFTVILRLFSFWDEEEYDSDYDFRVDGRTVEDRNDISTSQRNLSCEVRTPEESISYMPSILNTWSQSYTEDKPKMRMRTTEKTETAKELMNRHASSLQ